jgi:DNA-binding GntR family transcriptional regulator
VTIQRPPADADTPSAHGIAERATGSAERVAELLREEMVEGALLPGTPLREPALCERLGVSRNTLREALRLLGAAGLVHFGLYRGATVRQLGPADIGDIYIIRRTLELRAVEQTVHVSEANLAAISSLVDNQEQYARLGLWPEVATTSLRFHQALVALLGSNQLDAFFSNVIAQLRLLFAEAREIDTFQSPWVQRDREICDLIMRGRREQAAQALSTYLDTSEQFFIDYLRNRMYDHGRERQASP